MTAPRTGASNYAVNDAAKKLMGGSNRRVPVPTRALRNPEVVPPMSTAAVGPVSRFDRIDDETAEDQPFWLYDPEGVPVVMPSTCVGFQVRFWAPNQRGLGTIVTDARNGRPLILPRNVSPDEFAERVGYRVGRYRLFLLDGAHQRMHVDPGQIEITPEMAAARRGDLSTDVGAAPSAMAPAEPSGVVLGQVLAFVKESHAHALDQIASLQRDLAEAQRQTAAQLATVVGAVSGVLSAAGSSGLVKKTTALDAAAAGAPVTVQMVPTTTAPAPSNTNEAAPRNAASTPATVTAAAAEKSGVADALMALGMPLIEKLAPVAAYGMAQKMDVPDEVARDLAGFVKTTTQAAAAMLKADDAPAAEVAATAAVVAPRVGAELLAHVVRIQGGLSEDDRAWVSSLMSSAPTLLEALKPSVATLSVEEGIGAVRTLRAIDAAMVTPTERALFAKLLEPEVLPAVFRDLLLNRSTEGAIEVMRAQAAAHHAG